MALTPTVTTITNTKWDTLATDDEVTQTIAHLKENGIEAQVVQTALEAKERALELIPEGAMVMTMASVSVDSIGLAEVINKSGKYQSVKNKLSSMDRASQASEMQKLGAAPDWSVGSVHAVTWDGKIVVASNTGSQLGAYSYGAAHVIWIVGTQKIVKDLENAYQRLEEYTLPLESVRIRKAYGLPESFNSNISKLLIVNKEINPGRIHIIFVKENLGF